VGDLGATATLKRAIRGVSIVYQIGPACHPKERDMGFAMIEAARAAGVKHFIFSSVLHAIVTDLVQHEIKRDIEEKLISSGLEYTILQPTNYMLPLKVRSSFTDNVFKLSWTLERRQSMVDLGDIADVVVAVAREPERHSGATYELVGPGRHTAHDIAEIIARVVGHRISVEQIAPETYLKAVFVDFESREFEHQTKVHRSITRYLGAHDFVGNPNVLGWLLNRAPTSLESFVRSEFADYQSTRKLSGVR